MKLVLEMSEKEREAIRQAGQDIKNSFKKVKDSFQIRIVKEKKKEKKQKRKK